MPGPGIEAHEAERLRRGGVDHLPDVDPHPVAQHRELVDQRDVDRAEDVLEQLRQLRRLGRGDHQHLVADALVQPRRASARSPSVTPPTTFTVLRSVKSERPGSTRSGENATWKSRPAASPDSSSSGTSRSRVVPG